MAIELNYSSHPAHRLSRIVIAALAVALMTLAGGGGHGKAAAQVALAQLSLMLAWTAAIYVRRHGRSVRGSWLATLAWMTSVPAISLTCYQPICRILQAIPPIWGKNLPTAQATDVWLISPVFGLVCAGSMGMAATRFRENSS